MERMSYLLLDAESPDVLQTKVEQHINSESEPWELWGGPFAGFDGVAWRFYQAVIKED